MNSNRSHNGLYAIILFLRTVAIALFASANYYLVYYLSVLFSPGGGILFLAWLPVLIGYVVSTSLASIFFLLTVWKRIGLKQSLTTEKRIKSAVFIPLVMGLLIAAIGVVVVMNEGELNEDDVAKADIMYEIASKLQDQNELPNSLTEIDPEGSFSGSGVRYFPTNNTYQLCAMFEQDTRKMYEGDDREDYPPGVNFYKHPKGNHCFEIDPRY